MSLRLAIPLRRAVGLFRTRAALGLGPAATPVSLFVPLGFLLGPRALGILSPTALAYLDTAVSIGLATLGVLVGIALVRESRGAGRILMAASTEAAVAFAVVALASWVLVSSGRVPIESPVAAALMLGICASVSSVGPDEPEFAGGDRVAARVADLDDVLPIGLAAVAVLGPWTSAGWALTSAITGILTAVAVAIAARLLFERVTDDAERGVFVLGALALLGGSAAYLGVSPLFSGLVAGSLWTLAPGRADTVISQDLQKFQHPLVVLLLVVAGASVDPSLLAAWLAVPYVLFRALGKLIGGRVAMRVAPLLSPGELGPSLIWPGVLGVAFALNFQQVSPSSIGAALLAAVAMGVVASEWLALLVTPLPSPRA